MKIALIGCGFLGSIFLEELLKRLFAANRKDVEFLLVDYDHFEERNAANQNCTPKNASTYKVHRMAALAEEYGFTAHCAIHRINKKTGAGYLGQPDLIVDALDNLEARHLVYFMAMELSIPSLHLGITEWGQGTVEWVVPPGHDTWHLSPLELKIYPEAEQEKLPPCQLVQMRGVGLNMGLAAAKAVTLALKEDIEEYFDYGPQLKEPVYTNWSATNFGHVLEGVPYVQAQGEEEGGGKEEEAGQPKWSKERNA
jgi:molybdopterin/thiamine biosynthesis adenylyltransferase